MKTENNKQTFWDKLFNFCMILLFIKLAALLFSFSYLPASEVLIDLLLFLCMAFIILLSAAVMSNSGFSSGNGKGLFGRSGNAMVDNEIFNKIYKKYTEAAENYIKENDYKKAANIYLKLLQNPHKAAKTLEKGKLYSEAAIIYLKKLKDQLNAAKCYEKGLEYTKAIRLFTELEYHEKVGDLYKIQRDFEKAFYFYQIVIEKYLHKNQFLKASLVYRFKLEQPEDAQNLLLKGWTKNYDACNCLNNYFENITDVKILEKEINRIYTVTNDKRSTDFLKVIKMEYKKHAELQEGIKDIAYEIISKRSDKYPSFVSELQFFNQENTILYKDIALFRSVRSKILNP